MNPDLDPPLLLQLLLSSLLLRFWIVACAWTWLVGWAEARVTRPLAGD